MAIQTSDKIFVDVDDEINFVVEKILDSEKDRVILVIPQNALIISSLVSMQILSKQVVKSKKLLIVVTEDNFGLQLADRVSLIATTKVSNITPQLWEAAGIRKERYKAEVEKTKTELLTKRGAITEKSPIEAENPEPVVEEQVTESNPAEAATPKAEPETEVTVEEVEEVASKPKSKVKSEAEKIEGPIKRTRREPKLVKLAGFEILAGGDITSTELNSSGIMDGSPESDMDEEVTTTRKAPKPERPLGGFTGRDWTSHTKSKVASFTLPSLFSFAKRRKIAPGERMAGTEVDISKQRKRRRLMAIVAAIVVLTLGVVMYLIAFKLSTVEVKLTLKTAQVPIEQQITADKAVTTMDGEKLIIPAKEVVETDLSISATAKSTGEGKTGNKAAGLIDIWNKTNKVVTLKAGTTLQNTTTNLSYVLLDDVSVPAATGTAPSITIGQKVDVRMEASTFGTEYNITDSGTTKKDFKVDGYVVDDVIGQRFRPIDGGTSTTFVAVAQKDFDDAKDKLVTKLKEQANSKIQSQVPVGYRLIEGTQKFEESESSATPKVGEKGDDFAVSVKGKVSALTVSEDDLNKAISILVQKNQNGEIKFEIDGLADATIGNVKRDGDKVTFTVSSNGNLHSKVTPDDLKNAIAGKTLQDADDYLTGVEEIEKFKLTYSPEFVPAFLKRVPSDISRIKIQI